MDEGIEAAQVVTRDGQTIVVVAVRPSLLRDAKRSEGVVDVLSAIFPRHQIVLVASASDGLHYSSETPEAAEKIQREHVPLKWQRYSFA